MSISTNKPQTIVEILKHTVAHKPQQKVYTFLKDGETDEISLTFQQLDLQAKAIAAYLQELKLENARVVTIYPYDAPLEFIAAFLGCLYAAVIPVPCHPPRNRSVLGEIEARLKSAEAEIILTSKTMLNKLNKELPHINKIVTDKIPLTQAQEWVEPLITQDSLAFLQYTSGSTGNPKGVMVTHQCLLSNQEMLKMAFGHTENAIGVGWLPLFHDMGLIGTVLQALYLGASCVFLSPIAFVQKPLRWLQAISRYQAITSGAPNFAYELLCRHVTDKQLENLDLSSWEVAFCGAEPIRLETIEKFTAKFSPCGFRKQAFYPCYGMAEATLLISGAEKNTPVTIKYVDKIALQKNRVILSNTQKEGFKPIIGCGRAWLDGKIAIANPESLTKCADNEVGEIWASGSGIAKGYWNQPEETARTFHAYFKDTQFGSFLRTGDLGFIYNGELFITGRLHDVMVFWGFNHYPQQIEETVQKSHPSLKVNVGAAFAVEIEGQEKLIITQEIERSYRQSFPMKEVVEAVRWAVFNEHFIDIYAIAFLKTGTIPKTSSGKIQHSLCREKFLAGNLDIIAQWENPQAKTGDMISLLERYLNPLIHIGRYWAIVRRYLYDQII